MWQPPDIQTQDDFLLVMNTIGTLYEDDILNARKPQQYIREITIALKEGNIKKEYKHRPKPKENAQSDLETIYRLTDTGRMRIKIIKYRRGL